MTTRKQVADIATKVINGELPGNVDAAKTVIVTLNWINTLDLILGKVSTDAEANAVCVKAVAASQPSKTTPYV